MSVKVADLTHRVHQERNILDPVYCEEFIKKYRHKVLGEFRRTWTSEYDELMTDCALVERLKSDAPHVIAWFERRVDMILQAERREIFPTEVPAMLSGLIPLTQRSLPSVE